MSRSIFAAGLLAVLATTTPAMASPPTAVITSYEPEWQVLLPGVEGKREEDVGGVHLVTGLMGGAPIVLVESGIGPVNAAMATQIAIDRFHVRRIVVVGIAGGVDPALDIGDVAVPERWSSYLFSVFARSTKVGAAPAEPELPGFATNKNEHYGMIYPQPVPVGHTSRKPELHEGLDADAGLLAVARDIASSVALERCRAAGSCLSVAPRLVVGGAGVSGPAFVDNAAFRNYLATSYHARAVDMESAAVAQVASADGVPFIAFRSLSDLAGGGHGANEMDVFQALAAKNAATVLAAFMARVHALDAAHPPTADAGAP